VARIIRVMSSLKVPVGVTSVAGYSVTLASVAGAVVAYLQGDHSADNATVIALGVAAGLSFLSTQIGRYAQAHALSKQAAQVAEQERWAAAEQSKPMRAWEPDGDDPPPDEYAAADAWEQSAGEDAPPQAALYPLTDPASIPPDEGDARAEGSA
jgi:hypothetical protein